MENLYEATLSLARQTAIPVSKIAADNGISQRWFYRFILGDYKDPGVNRIQRLYDYLSTKSTI